MKGALFGCALLLAACGGASPPPAPAEPKTGTMQVPAWAPDVDLPRGTWHAAKPDAAANLLHIAITKDGARSTRTSGPWQQHETEEGVLSALRDNAGVIDLDSGHSELQVVLRMDRGARWDEFLGLQEMLRMAGSYRLYVETVDGLADFTRPVGAPPLDRQVAGVLLEREGGSCKVSMQLDGADYSATGPGFAADLKQWAAAAKSPPKLLVVRLPAEEPFQTLFTVLDALRTLNPAAVTFGG